MNNNKFGKERNIRGEGERKRGRLARRSIRGTGGRKDSCIPGLSVIAVIALIVGNQPLITISIGRHAPLFLYQETRISGKRDLV